MKRVLPLFITLCAGCPEKVAAPTDDGRGCTPANHCLLVDGAAECEPGYGWLESDATRNDYRCVAPPDAGTPQDSGTPDATATDATARDTALAIDAARPDAAHGDATRTDAVHTDAARSDTFVPPTGAPTFDLPYRYPGLPVGYTLLDDVNGDGRVDAVQVESFNPIFTLNVRVQLAQAAGGFTPTFEAAVTGHAGHVVATCDVNGDGYRDLAVTSGDGHGVYLFTGTGDGTFATPPANLTYGYAPAAFGDFDGDGRCDVLEFQSSSNFMDLHRSLPAGGFGSARVDNVRFRTLTTGDVDGDGNLDVVLASDSYPYSLRVFRSLDDGSLTAWGSAVACPTCDDANDMRVADLNHDGRSDVAVGGAGLALFNGTASGLVAGASFPLAHVQSLLAADVDGDGHHDIIAISQPVLTTANVGLEVLYGPGFSDVRRFYNLQGAHAPTRLVDHDSDGHGDLLLDDEWVYAGRGGRELQAPRLSFWPVS